MALHLRIYKNLVLLSALLLIPAAFLWNNGIFYAVNCSRHSTVLNWFFLVLTSLADGLWIMMIATIVYSLRPRDFAVFLLALILGNVLLQSGKHFFDMDRPLKVLGAARVCVLGLPVTVRSFPSGHAFSALLLFMFLRPKKTGWVTAVLFLICALAALSRVYVGAHFPRDVAMGGLIAVFSYLAAELLRNKLPSVNPGGMLSHLGIAVIGVGTSLIYIFKYPEKTPELEFVLTPLAWGVICYWLIYTARKVLLLIRQRESVTGTKSFRA